MALVIITRAVSYSSAIKKFFTQNQPTNVIWEGANPHGCPVQYRRLIVRCAAGKPCYTGIITGIPALGEEATPR